ncbi:MAG: hypothetical protein ACTSUE_15125 [Promethearchaeota archaeon]
MLKACQYKIKFYVAWLIHPVRSFIEKASRGMEIRAQAGKKPWRVTRLGIT